MRLLKKELVKEYLPNLFRRRRHPRGVDSFRLDIITERKQKPQRPTLKESHSPSPRSTHAKAAKSTRAPAPRKNHQQSTTAISKNHHNDTTIEIAPLIFDWILLD